MVTVDDSLTISTDAKTIGVKPFVAHVYSKRYGLQMVLEYDRQLTARRALQTRMENEADNDYYELYENGELILTKTFGYDVRYAIRRLRAFRNSIRPVIGGWEIEAEGFRLLVDKGYIVPAENHLEHEAGFWLITDRARQS